MMVFNLRTLTALIVCLAAESGIVSAQPVVVHSPDGANTIELYGTGGEPDTLGLKISRLGRVVLDVRSVKVSLAGRGELSGAAQLDEVAYDAVDETFTTPWGKAREVRNRCARAKVRLIDRAGIVWDVELVAYDDGVAFRYGLPEQQGLTEFTLTEESADFRLSDVPTLHYTALDRFTTDHEIEFRRAALTDVAGPLIDLPLLAVWPDGSAAGITEARVRDFPNLYLEPSADPASGILHTRLSPRIDRPDACLIGRTPHSSPWRVVLLGDKAGRLLESNLLVCLNDPPAGDFSWAKPGKTTWHWWNGTFDHAPDLDPGMNLETHKRYIDFCARYGIAYHAVVADRRPWHVQAKEDFAPQPDTDILTPRPELHLPEILRYARERGVEIRLWVHWKPLDAQLEEAFQRYEDWGVSGLMIDFLDSDDQYMVNFCERALESAARHKLHIQFHGSYKPSGEQRTFPNLFNREGVLNLEYLKWSTRCTPPHSVEAAYVRQLAGPLDYHLGGFRSIAREDFVAQNDHPFVYGTRCHNLAMYVVYENPMPMVADTPEAYESQTGFDFVVAVPTTWDETRFVTGDAGDYVVVARRNGATWYVGGMNDWTARTVEVPLTYLGPGSYEARLYVDGAPNKDKPNEIRVVTRSVEAGGTLPIAMATGGGFAAIIAPK